MTRTAVVTGANKGIGLEIVRQLLDLGWVVWLGSRDPGRGREAVEQVRGEQHAGEVRPLAIDVTDDASVEAAAATVAETGVDVLVNNAGIAGRVPAPAEATAADIASVLETNTVAPVRVIHAFLPLVRRSGDPLVVNISSGLGTFARMADMTEARGNYPDLAYPASKAALNMLTVVYARQVPEVRFLAVAPGHTATDLNAFSGAQTPQQAGAIVVAAITAEGVLSPSYVGANGPSAW